MDEHQGQGVDEIDGTCVVWMSIKGRVWMKLMELVSWKRLGNERKRVSRAGCGGGCVVPDGCSLIVP
jgi:hypothetical protein